MAPDSPQALCVFPGLSGPMGGGIQLSGRIAWQAIVEHARSLRRDADLLVYGLAEEQDCTLAGSWSRVSATRLRALWSAWSWQRRAPLICFWHVGLLKLLPLLRAANARVVLFLHGVEVWRPCGLLTGRLLKRVDLFLSNSDFTWRRFLEFHSGLADRPHATVALGCDAPAVLRGEQPDETPAALMLGRLARGEDYKGHREMIATWPRVVERIPQAELWIAGDGDLRGELETSAEELGLASRVRFFGYVGEQRKQDLLRRCRCLALPSRGEGFGLVYLEAMRLGRPCLVSTEDAGREVINPPEAGLAADPAHAGELLSATCRLLTGGEEWECWSRSARERYESHLTSRHFQGRLINALFGETTTRAIRREP